MKQSADLKRLLTSIDHKSYPAYKDVRGAYDFNTYILSIDHVQGDPFASPSKVSIQVRHAKAGFPAELFDLRARHPLDIGRNLRKILIQVKLAQHIAAARHRKNRNLLSKHPRQGFPRVKFRHQTRFLDFADLVSGDVKPPMFLNFPLNPVFIK